MCVPTYAYNIIKVQVARLSKLALISLFIFVTFQCDVDMAAIAYSYVYFEKLVLMVSR